MSLVGFRSNAFEVIEDTGKTSKHGHKLLLCRCDCGNIVEKIKSHIINEAIKTCGCQTGKYSHLRLEFGEEKVESLMKTWKAIQSRCYNRNFKEYKNYGGKGIELCEDWLFFENFFRWAIESGWEDGLEISRINHSLNYSPENCEWSTREDNIKEQWQRNLKNKEGIFSEEANINKMQTNRKNLGAKIILENDQKFLKFNSLGEASEYIISIRPQTKYSSAKKNISACLHGKRKSCYGYTCRHQ